MTVSIGKLACKFNLSRSTLLYYDSIGILSPSKRSVSNYRVYSEEDCRRLEKIATYRKAGLSLQEIKEMLDGSKCVAVNNLEAKLEEINKDIIALREQQFFIINLLQNNQLLERVSTIEIDCFAGVLESAGVDEKAQWRIHNQFEKSFPEKHEAFLQLLGLTPERVREIRKWAQEEQK
ncbi:MAG: transcriptional regulator, MerR family [Firmicutes bacterium]|nr:transcriptional regulator, MerR family [Bacillota bacterium]